MNESSKKINIKIIFNAIINITFFTSIFITLLISIFRSGVEQDFFSIIVINKIIIVCFYTVNRFLFLKKNIITAVYLLLILLIPFFINNFLLNLIIILIIVDLILNYKIINLIFHQLNIVIFIAFILSLYIVLNQLSIFSGTHLFSQEYAKIGWYSTSAYFHASIAEIYKNHQLISSGLNGYIPIYYHVYSHIWFSEISKIFNLNIFKTYSIIFQIIIIPLFFLVMMHIALIYIRFKNIVEIAIYLLVLLAYISIFPSIAFESESFLFGFIFLFIGAFALIYKEKYYISNTFVLNALIFCLIFVNYLSKVSTGLILTIIYLIFFFKELKKNKPKNFVIIINIILSSIFSIIVTKVGFSIFDINISELYNYITKIHPTDNTEIQRIPFYNFLFKYNQIHSIRTIILSGVAFYLLKKYKPGNINFSFIFEIIIIIGVFLAAFDIARDDSIYFTHISELISLAIICAFISRKLLDQVMDYNKSLKRNACIYFLYFLVLIIIIRIGFGFINFFDSVQAIKNNTLQNTLYEKNYQHILMVKNWFFSSEQKNEINKSIDSMILSTVAKEILNFKNSTKGDIGTAVHITHNANELIKTKMNEYIGPKKINQYLPRKCSENYLVTSFTGIPTILSVYYDNNSFCNKYIFGFKYFNYSTIKNIDKFQLCDEALKINVKNILIIDSLDNSIYFKNLYCKKNN